MMRKVVSVTVFCLLLHFFAISQLDWSALNKGEYTIMHPVSWERNFSGLKGSKFYLLSPVESAHDHFRENISYISKKLGDATFSPDSYAEYFISKLKEDNKIRKIEITSLKIDSIDARKITYETKDGKDDMHIEQVVFIRGNFAHILSINALETSSEVQMEIARKIVGSFKFNDAIVEEEEK